ncbi:MAG: hypothetical protein ACTSYI_09220 [Promethearchaeota archaeon]
MTKKREINNAILNQDIYGSRRNKILFQQIFQFNFLATLFTFVLVFIGTLFVVSAFPAPWLISFVGDVPDEYSSSLFILILFFLAKFVANIIEGGLSMFLGFGFTFAIKRYLLPYKTEENQENPDQNEEQLQE